MSFIRPGRLATRVTKRQTVQTSLPLIFPGPSRGLLTSFANNDAERTATILCNFWPTLNGARIRGGCEKLTSLGNQKPVITAFAYNLAPTEKIFLASEQAIYDVTGMKTTSESKAVVTGMTSGNWSVFQHAMPEKGFLIAVNGRDERQIYNGQTWQKNYPSMTFADRENMTSADLLYGWLFKNRQWYVQTNSMNAWYLPVKSIGGIGKLFPLGSVMQQGGSLLAGFAWSMESGDGMATVCGFLSTVGEIAIYAGDDPDNASSFILKGLYQIGRPLGKNAIVTVNGDVWIATTEGLLSMNQLLRQGRQETTISLFLSQSIKEEWQAAIAAMPIGWSLTLWREQNILLASFPANPVMPDTTFVMNLLNKSWSILHNWQTQAYVVAKDKLFFGDLKGNFWIADISGTDNDLPFTAIYLSGFQAAASIGQIKRTSLAYLDVKARTPSRLKLFARADQDISYPSFAKVTMKSDEEMEIGVWDNSLWDLARWDKERYKSRPFSFRQNVCACGHSLAVGCMMISGGTLASDAEIETATLMIERGDVNL